VPERPTDQPGPATRAREYASRARQAPAAVAAASAELAALRAALDTLRHELGDLRHRSDTSLDDLQARAQALDDAATGWVEGLARLDHGLSEVDVAVEAHATALLRAVAAPARAAAARALHEALGPPTTLRPGLSIFTLCWNHGELLPEAVRSGLAVLDRLPADQQGQVLVLDDASSDRTAEVVAALAAGDERVRVVRAEVNLGLARARTALLHVSPTTHAFQLDADNTAFPDGVLDLHRVATTTGAALTYGTVVQEGEDGTPHGPISNEPPTEALFRANYVDTMALTDVAAFRALGGWDPDPLLEHVDDWATIHRVARAGLLLAFVPTLVGRYRVLDTAFHLTVSDPRIGARRVARVFDPAGRFQGPDPLAGVAAVAVHPDTGPLWATPAAVALDPDLAPAPSDPAPVAAPARRLLVIAPGGVANLGDDAITVRGLERLRGAFGDDVALDLVTDGAAPSELPTPVRWLGPLIDVLPGLRMEELGRLDAALDHAAAALRIGEGRWRPLEPGAYAAAVVLGGGSLSSSWSEGLIGPRAVLAAALRTAGVPYACSGQGIGPLDPGDDRALAAGLLAGAAAVATRDEASAALARSLPGVDPTRVAATGDDALGLAAPDLDRPDRPTLVVSLRRAGYVGDPARDPARAWAVAADALAAERGWDVRGVALNAQDPEPEIATLAQIRATTDLRVPWHLVDCGPDPRRLVALVAGAVGVATQSFHAALFGLAAGLPTVLGAASPYYRGKAEGLAQRAGLPAELAVADPAEMGAALDTVAGALGGRAAPLAGAEAAVDAWWGALPGRLDAARAVSG